MKTRLFFLPVLALTATLSVSAQQIENDDLYFNSKDRAKQKASRAASLSVNNEIVAKGIKSSDQYSGRAVNPEYTSRLNANSNTVQGSSNPYFDSDYKSTTTSNNGSGNFNNFNSPYYGNSFYSPYNSLANPYSSFYDPYSSFYSPYSSLNRFSPYNSFYSPFYSPMYSPYGYSSSLSMSMGFGSSFGYNPMMFGYGFGSYYGGYPHFGYPTKVIINNGNGDNGSNIVYGKRSSRGGSVNAVTSNNRRTVSSTTADQDRQVIPVSGRTSSTQQYYQPNWRNNPEVITNSRQNSGSAIDRSQSLGTHSPSWNGGTMSRQSQNPDWNTARPSIPSNNSFESPSRSSTPSWGGSGGGNSSGGTRGRN